MPPSLPTAEGSGRLARNTKLLNPGTKGDFTGDDAMAFAPDAPAGGETSMVTVPVKPTAAMVAAGARAGDVSVEAAWRVFRAMVQQTG